MYYGTWGTVCYQSNFHLNSANVACRSLGFPAAVRASRYLYDTRSDDQVWLNNVQCKGNEIGLEHCSHDGFGNVPSHCDDVCIECIGEFTLQK